MHHQIVMIESAGKTAVFAADLLPTAAHLPEVWVMGYDLPRSIRSISSEPSCAKPSTASISSCSSTIRTSRQDTFESGTGRGTSKLSRDRAEDEGQGRGTWQTFKLA